MSFNDCQEITLRDVQDKISKYRRALGFVADRVEDSQVSAALSVIEEGISVTEDMIAYLLRADV